jgi:hypothetical protein
MSTAKKVTAPYNPESYSPKQKPEILNLAGHMRKTSIPDEILVESIDDYCSIVDRAAMKIVGIKVIYTPNSSSDIIKTAGKYIKDGTCELLEDMVGNMDPGKYVAVMTDVKTGIDFTYIVGVAVKDADNLPEALPPDTVTFICPAGRYGKRMKKEEESAKNTLSSFSYTDFRTGSGYVYDKRSHPYQFFDSNGELLVAYEPVKIPADNEEKYDSVGWEIVALPGIKAVGCTGEGLQCMFDLFEIENSIDWQKAGAVNMQQYVSFGLETVNGTTSFMGRQVYDLDHVPDKLTAINRPGRLYVRFYQMQINNDNPTIFYEGARDVLFFNKHPEYELDYSDGFYDLFLSQYEQGSNVYFPIRRKAERS